MIVLSITENRELSQALTIVAADIFRVVHILRSLMLRAKVINAVWYICGRIRMKELR